MPLSEREQALLQQMEQALYAEDPRFAEQLANPTPPSNRRRRLLLGFAAIVAGLAVVLLGVTQQQVVVGVLGFLVMVGGGLYAFAAPARPGLGTVDQDGSIRRHPAGTGRGLGQRLGAQRVDGARRPQARPQRSGTFMQRLEERWEERRRRGDF